ncbi:TRAP transporter substrate-binding protein DctP [Oleispirillum naphthae]|uniref:TRAP transporter substrate-binding protein n=1 Tax=Oleispirillum naphthae TaxID=2838853 RepID=UPI00308252A7
MNKWMISAVVGLGLALTAADAGAATVLRLTSQMPAKHHVGQNLLAFKAEVEKESKGDLKIEIYPASQLYKDEETPQAVSTGAVDMGSVSLAQFAGTVPAVDVFYVPFLFDTEARVRAATAPGSPIRTELDAAILKTGTRVLWWQAFGGSILITKGFSVHMPDDLKGKKVRVFGKTLGKFIEAVGGAPTMLSGSEQFLAYQRGTVDAGMTGITTVPARKLYQVTDGLTVTNNADVEFIVIVNEKAWQGLTAKQRAIIETAGRKVEASLRDEVSRLEADALAINKTKMKVVELTDAERAAWRAATKPVIAEFVQWTGPIGQKLIDEALKLK